MTVCEGISGETNDRFNRIRSGVTHTHTLYGMKKREIKEKRKQRKRGGELKSE